MSTKILGISRRKDSDVLVLNIGNDYADGTGARVIPADDHGIPVRVGLDDPAEIDKNGKVWVKGIRLITIP